MFYYKYSIDIKRTTAHKVVWPPHNGKRITTPSLAKVPGWFFYALKHYLINVNTNVSNASMNIPKAVKSLKSKWFLLFISTTPILCRIEAATLQRKQRLGILKALFCGACRLVSHPALYHFSPVLLHHTSLAAPSAYTRYLCQQSNHISFMTDAAVPCRCIFIVGNTSCFIFLWIKYLSA